MRPAAAIVLITSALPIPCDAFRIVSARCKTLSATAVLPADAGDLAQAAQRLRDQHVVWTQLALANPQRALEERARPVVEPELLMHGAQRLHQARLKQWLARELTLDARGAARKQVTRGERVATRAARIAHA